MAGRQFGRVCILKFTNFATKKTWTIDGRKLRVSFDFFKSYDEVDTASTGSINIYGLTQETQIALGNRIGDMFQTEVTCIAGYSSDPDNIQVLFKGVVMNNFRVMESGIFVTKIQVSANYKDWKLSGAKSFSFKNESLMKIFGDSLGYFNSSFAISSNGVPTSDVPALAKFFETAKIPSFTFSGTQGELVERFCIEFGLRVITNKEEKAAIGVEESGEDGINDQGGAHYTFVLRNAALIRVMISAGRSAISQESKNKVADIKILLEKPNVSSNVINPLQTLFQEDDPKKATVLSFQTGLRERPYLDNRNIKVPYDRKLQENEAIDEKKEQKVKISKKTGKPMIDKKTGKVKIYTPKTMVINRRFLSVKAQINPSVKPNSQVKISINDTQFDGIYRVRNIKFNGDTWDGEWVMDMELEDTADFREATATGSLASEQESESQELEEVSDSHTPYENGELDSE